MKERLILSIASILFCISYAHSVERDQIETRVLSDSEKIQIEASLFTVLFNDFMTGYKNILKDTKLVNERIKQIEIFLAVKNRGTGFNDPNIQLMKRLKQECPFSFKPISESNNYSEWIAEKYKKVLFVDEEITWKNNNEIEIRIGVFCGKKCGGGGIYLLTRELNIWKVVRRVGIWRV